MKFVKYLVVFAIAVLAIPTLSNAQTVQAVGGGSSAIFLELGQGAASSSATATPCVWTQSKAATMLARDNRTSPATDEQGDMWITWSQGTGTCAAPAGTFNIYSDMKLDSVVGVKCYFEVDSSGIPGCVQVLTVTTGTAGNNLLGTGFTDTAIPSSVITALNGHHFTYGATDIRPEDAKFASYRMFQPCGNAIYRNNFDLEYRLTYGLGYATGTTGVGLQVKSAFSSALFNVLDFAISGPDPISGNNAPSFAVSAIGAQPIVVGVAPITDTTGIAAATDINGFTLSLFYEGVLARSTDLVGPTVTNPVVTLVREPLSGTYNTMEFSMPNSSQFHTSQDDNFCNGSAVSNQIMNQPSALGKVSGAARKRVIGTGEMVSTLNNTTGTTDMLGYFFWSQANANGKTNIKYLTVNGVDPLLDSYAGGGTFTPGLLPQSGGTGTTPPLTAVTFKALNNGDYPIWSAVRIVGVPGEAGVTSLISASHAVDATQHDYIALANMKVWHSHFPIYGITDLAANGSSINTANDLCSGGAVEAGGDAGGANVSKQVNVDFCSDFGVTAGLVNKSN